MKRANLCKHSLVILVGNAAPEDARDGDDERDGEEHNPCSQRAKVVDQVQILFGHFLRRSFVRQKSNFLLENNRRLILQIAMRSLKMIWLIWFNYNISCKKLIKS